MAPKPRNFTNRRNDSSLSLHFISNTFTNICHNLLCTCICILPSVRELLHGRAVDVRDVSPAFAQFHFAFSRRLDKGEKKRAGARNNWKMKSLSGLFRYVGRQGRRAISTSNIPCSFTYEPALPIEGRQPRIAFSALEAVSAIKSSRCSLCIFSLIKDCISPMFITESDQCLYLLN